MVHAPAAPPRQARRGVRLVLAVQALSVVLVAGGALGGAALALVVAACLLAEPVPTELSEYPVDTPQLASTEKR